MATAIRTGMITTANALWLILIMGTSPAAAHEGPPFPILMDHRMAGQQVSVWIDPDIGEGRLFVIVEAPGGGPPTSAPVATVWIQPVNGRLPRVEVPVEPQNLRGQLQFNARPYFDQGDFWTIGVRITNASGESEEWTTEVESTPPGYGEWDFALYLFPFLLLGVFWGIAILRRRRIRMAMQASADLPHPGVGEASPSTAEQSSPDEPQHGSP